MRIITGLFEPNDAFTAVDELLKGGFSVNDLSLVSSAAEMPAFLEGDPEASAAGGVVAGAVVGGAAGALGAWIAPNIPGFETMLAAGLLTTASGSVIGGYLGSLFSVRADGQTKLNVHEALAEGKVLLVVKVDPENPTNPQPVMIENNAEDMEVHDMPAEGMA